MQSTAPIRTDLVLLGAGHAHVEVLRRFARQPEPGVRLTLVAREPETPYSGMLPGLIRGDYDPAQAHIDLAPLASAAGARLILAEATGLDLQARQVAIAGRPPLAYDLLSIDVGGVPALPPGSDGVPVKPIGGLRARLIELAERLPPGGRVAVIGGGPAGCELAIALMRGLRGRARIALVSETAEPVAQAPAHARRVVRAALVDCGVELISGVRALGVAAGRLHLSDGSAVEVAEALWATGAVG
ncbi:MAG TPA: FAD-dependent oxidoreductase, partial [Acetobacteraceae bacterium]|nr:FAD-dependent oxidoreductase [Acetobacteraceae bacterium]